MTTLDEKQWRKELNGELESQGFERYAPPVTTPVYVTIYKRIDMKYIHYTHVETRVLGQDISYGPDGIEIIACPR